MIIRVHALISGQVQGVSFRYYTERAAKHLGLSGWVKNLPDGRVEVIAEGEEVSVNELIKILKQGPKLASISKVEVINEKPEGLTKFKIIY